MHAAACEIEPRDPRPAARAVEGRPPAVGGRAVKCAAGSWKQGLEIRWSRPHGFGGRILYREAAPPQQFESCGLVGAQLVLAELPRVAGRRGVCQTKQTLRTAGSSTVRQTLEDAPFYARSVLDSRLYGERVEAVHETLDLDRFRLPVVKLMLPFRMPRRA